MTATSRQNVGQGIAIFICFFGIVLMLLGPLTRRVGGQEATKSSPAMKLTQLGFKFDGSRTCRGSNCHDKAGDETPPAERGHEFTIWDSQDKHAKAFDHLSKSEKADPVAMGKALNIADVKADAACLNCHAVNVPENLRGEKFNIKDGNSCGSCHGPSEKWLKPHAEKGWTDQQRKAMDHETLLKTLGLFDTKPISARAQLCTSCHLAIDAEMVAAGHPQPTFELAYYSEIEPAHWPAPEGFEEAKIWAAGQAASVHDAMIQLASRAKAKKDAEAVKTAYQQAMAHATVFKPAAAALGVDAAALDAHLAAMSKASSDNDVLAREADAVATMAAQALTKVDLFEPNKASTSQMLGGVASQSGMASSFGQFGMDQQSMSIMSLFNAYATGEKMPDSARDELSKLIESKLMPETPPAADQFDKNVAEVKAKLPG